MNNKGIFYTNVSDYETKEDMMNDFIALRMYDIAKDKEIERLNNIIKEVREYIKNTMEVDEEYPDYMTFEICEYQELLDILDKGNK